MAGSIRHPLVHHHRHHENEVKIFSRKVAATIKKAHSDDHFEKIVLLAEPCFLGIRRDVLPCSINKLVKQAIPKEYRQGSDRHLRSLVMKALISGAPD